MARQASTAHRRNGMSTTKGRRDPDQRPTDSTDPTDPSATASAPDEVPPNSDSLLSFVRNSPFRRRPNAQAVVAQPQITTEARVGGLLPPRRAAARHRACDRGLSGVS